MGNGIQGIVSHKNLVAESQIAKIKSAHESGLTQRCYDDAIHRFNLFHILNHIMYDYSLTVADELDDAGLLRFELKKYWNEGKRTFERYKGKMQRCMDVDAYALMQDYTIAAERSIDPKILALQTCIKRHMDEEGCTDTELLSKLAVAIRLAEIIVAWFNIYFNSYKELCGIDFRNDFSYARMDVFLFNLLRIFDKLSAKNPTMDFGKDEACRIATTELQKEMADERFVDDAAKQALMLSDKYRPMYEEMKQKKEEKNGDNTKGC